MNKIARPQELVSELHALVQYSASGEPSREVIAAKLRDLATRTASKNLHARIEEFMEEAGKYVARKIHWNYKGMEMGKVVAIHLNTSGNEMDVYLDVDYDTGIIHGKMIGKIAEDTPIDINLKFNGSTKESSEHLGETIAQTYSAFLKKYYYGDLVTG